MINSVCGIRSTGRICTDLAEKMVKEGHVVKIAYGRETVPKQYEKYAVRIGNGVSVRINALKVRCFDNEGFNAKLETVKFLKWADEFDPDIVWLHNLHGYYINIELLFEWIKSRSDMKVKWMLHDCWSFTGHCVHFTFANCIQWKSRCRDCLQISRYPSSIYRDNCEENFNRKRASFTGVANMTIITPSQWLADLVAQSFLKEYPIEVHHNTIDKTVFKPTESNFRNRYGLEDKKIVLGVASAWGEIKGLNDFIKLSEMLNDNYKVVLVGLSNKQIKRMPKNIIALHRTNSTKELAEIYTSADVFLNLSREETFGMTTIEAKACGTEVIVYKGTACEEVVNAQGGIAVDQGDLHLVTETIYKLC